MSLTYLSFLAKRDSQAICFRDFLGGVYHAPFNIVGYGGTQLGLGLGLVRCIRVGGGNMHFSRISCSKIWDRKMSLVQFNPKLLHIQPRTAFLPLVTCLGCSLGTKSLRRLHAYQNLNSDPSHSQLQHRANGGELCNLLATYQDLAGAYSCLPKLSKSWLWWDWSGYLMVVWSWTP